MRARLAEFIVVAGLPAGLLLAALWLHPLLATAPAPLRALFPFLPHATLGAALLLALIYGRGRALFPLLLLATWYLVASAPPAWTWRGRPLDADALLLGGAFLLPLNVALLALPMERGILNRHGLLRLALPALQAGLLAVLATGGPRLLAVPLAATPFADVPWTGPPTQPIALAFAVAIALLLGRYLLRRGPLEFGLAWALAAVALAQHLAARPGATALLTACAGLLVLLALLQESHRMAYRDDLTGLPGRRALQEALQRLGPRYAIAMLDVDHFKKFNDTHGHDVGDQVLKLVAARMREVRGGGRPYRYGGEEFTVLFPGKSVAYAVPHLEALREAIAASSFRLRGGDRPQASPQAKDKAGTKGRGRHRRGGKEASEPTVSVTVSIGVAERDAHHATPDMVIRRADEALYLAKGGGRNRVCH